MKLLIIHFDKKINGVIFAKYLEKHKGTYTH